MSEGPDAVINNPEKLQFEIWSDKNVATLQYRYADGKVVFFHTEVPQAMEGQGIGSRLAKAGLGFARENGLKIVPECSFIAGYIKKKSPEFDDLLD
jgi:predicted GNAT family acetyltransferase